MLICVDHHVKYSYWYNGAMHSYCKQQNEREIKKLDLKEYVTMCIKRALSSLKG